MPGISNRIVAFANFYNQLKFLIVVLGPFVKRDPPCRIRLDQEYRTAMF
jgi:hypothetical protein